MRERAQPPALPWAVWPEDSGAAMNADSRQTPKPPTPTPPRRINVPGITARWQPASRDEATRSTDPRRFLEIAGERGDRLLDLAVSKPLSRRLSLGRFHQNCDRSGF